MALISGVGYLGAPALQCMWPQEWSRIRLKDGLMWFSHKINICAPLKVSDIILKLYCNMPFTNF